ncbi:hypothetical protein AAG570_000269 [Ranatra chinensis]|uniref:Ubiquitin-like domain-containing protein n=1 Tax=Ranatra chinensis TaxID=642074 RepID=A0ABD0Z714_9HEMI
MSFQVVSPDDSTQIVKVTPHTTVLQILEEVCQAKGVSAEDFNLTYDDIVLDKNCKLHYGGLTDGTQLRLLEIPASPKIGPIVISFEVKYLRFIGHFTEDDSVWTVVTNLCPRGILDKENAVPVVFCNQHQIAGVRKLQETNLGLLGLKSGRVVMRMEMRDLDAPTKSNKKSVSSKSNQNKRPLPEFQRRQQEGQLQQLCLHQKQQHQQQLQQRQKEQSQNMKAMARERSSSIDDEGPKPKEPTIDPTVSATVDDFQYIGGRNAMLFTMPDNYTISTSLPEDFFDLRLDEAKNIYKNLINQRLELEQQPLMTQAMRQQMAEDRFHKKISMYKRCIIRILFPGQIVLQGVFEPTEMISDVITFVRGFLQNPNLQFYLYTTPPKAILDTGKRLIDLNFVPLARMYFGVNSQIRDNCEDIIGQFVRDDLIMSSLTSYEQATAAAIVIRNANTDSEVAGSSNVRDQTTLDRTGGVFPSQTTPLQAEQQQTSNVEERPQIKKTGKGQVPKWFRMPTPPKDSSNTGSEIIGTPFVTTRSTPEDSALLTPAVEAYVF